jgi:hypothetical protein
MKREGKKNLSIGLNALLVGLAVGNGRLENGEVEVEHEIELSRYEKGVYEFLTPVFGELKRSDEKKGVEERKWL